MPRILCPFCCSYTLHHYEYIRLAFLPPHEASRKMVEKAVAKIAEKKSLSKLEFCDASSPKDSVIFRPLEAFTVLFSREKRCEWNPTFLVFIGSVLSEYVTIFSLKSILYYIRHNR